MKENIKSMLLALLLILFALSFCFDFNYGINSSQTKDIDRSAIEKEINNIYHNFSKAYAILDVQLVADLYRDDALYLSGEGEIRKGKDNISPTFKRYFEWAKSNNASLEINFDIQQRTISDSLVTDVGYYLINTTYLDSLDLPVKQSAGKFITIINQDKEGNWKFIADGYNSAPPEIVALN